MTAVNNNLHCQHDFDDLALRHIQRRHHLEGIHLEGVAGATSVATKPLLHKATLDHTWRCIKSANKVITITKVVRTFGRRVRNVLLATVATFSVFGRIFKGHTDAAFALSMA